MRAIIGYNLIRMHPNKTCPKSEKRGSVGIARKKKVCMTKLEIIQLGTKMFIEEGYTKTSAVSISRQLGISTGNLTFHFPTKEHLLLELVKYLASFHEKCINGLLERGYDELHAYCWEVAAQIALCEDHETARDLYLSAYSHPLTLEYIKQWIAEKNDGLLAVRIPNWSEFRLRKVEHMVAGIEYAALLIPRNGEIDLREKISLTLESLLKLYEVPREVREQVIADCLEVDYHAIGIEILKNFTDYIERLNQEAIENLNREAMEKHTRLNNIKGE